MSRFEAGIPADVTVVPAGAFQFRGADYNGPVTLLGQCCTACGHVTFPKRYACPKCFSHSFQELLLPERGTVRTFTIVRKKMPGYSGDVPYVVGQVELTDQVTVLGHLTGQPHADWYQGQDVRPCGVILGGGHAAEEKVVTFGFRPARDEIES